MEDGHLVDYLMASAAFPGFESPSIEGKHYVDGGFYDNVPYAMARKRGYRRVIVSDISGLGRNRRPQTDGCVTAYIKNSIDMGGVLSFDHAFREAFLLLGWLDTMRVFGRLVGYSYFLEPDAEAEASCSAAECVDAAILPDRMRWDRRKLLVHLECAASILDVERVKAWTYAGLADEISRKRAAEEEHIQKLLGGAKGGMRGQVSTLRKAIADRSFDHSPYYYARLIASAVPKTAGAILGKALVGLYPELPAGMAWLDHAAIKH
jgi:NTE family protein